MQKALWKGAISFGSVHIPVRLYSAEKNHDLDLIMLDRRDLSPIGYLRINKKTGEEVAWEDIVKAYEYEPGQYVVVSDEDIKTANVGTAHTIDILNFVDAQQVPWTYYDKPYYLIPDKGSEKVYALIRETLWRTQKIGIVKIAMHAKPHLAALVPQDDMIVLNTLRYTEQIRAVDEFELPPSNPRQAGITPKEIEMAISLVDGMTEDWDPHRFHNTFKEDVLAIVREKIEGGKANTVTEPQVEIVQPAITDVSDLVALLEESLRTARGEKAVPQSSRMSHAHSATGRRMRESSRKNSNKSNSSKGKKSVSVNKPSRRAAE
jgi:DNA end-binding protein Ku